MFHYVINDIFWSCNETVDFKENIFVLAMLKRKHSGAGVVERLPSLCEALGSILSTAYKINKIKIH